MITIDQVAATVRAMIRVAPGQLVAPRALARGLDLDLLAESGCRARLEGFEVFYDDTVSEHEQDYQIGRFACTYALLTLRLVRSEPHLTAHALVGALCRLASAPPLAPAAPVIIYARRNYARS